MSILEANGSIACAECGRKARAEYDQLQTENAKLQELCHDMLAVIIGWSWKFNELAGYQLDNEDTYPSMVMRGFIDRARELGVEV